MTSKTRPLCQLLCSLVEGVTAKPVAVPLSVDQRARIYTYIYIYAEQLPVLRQQESDIRRNLECMAIDLSAARRGASTHLRHAVEGCLTELAMMQSRFDVRIGWELQEGAVNCGGAGVATLHVGEAANMIGAHLCAHIWRLLLCVCH